MQKGERLYARVRYGKDDRIVVRVPSAKNHDECDARAEFIASLVDLLVTANREDLIKKVAKEAANATTAKGLASVRKAVEGIAAGKHDPARITGETFKEFANRWESGELHRLWPDRVPAVKGTRSNNRARLDKYILKHVGKTPLVAFTLDDGMRVMEKLPKMSSANRRHIAQIMHRVLALAVFPARLIPSNPLPKGFLPRIIDSRRFPSLYPDEERALLSCAEVPIAYRMFFGVLDREGMRLSELLDADWTQFDLVRGVFTIDTNKTNDPRAWALAPDVVSAMKRWRLRCKDPKPFTQIDSNHIAGRLRDFLELAGVDRSELFQNDAVRGQMRVHDLRATFVTISLAEGKSETWIRDRTAHKSTSMIDRYRRAARMAAELNLGPLAPLPVALGWATSWATPIKKTNKKPASKGKRNASKQA